MRQPTQRYVQRNEFFGSIVYDREDKEYYHLDHLASSVLKNPTVEFSDGELAEFDADREDLVAVQNELLERRMLGNTLFVANKPLPGMLSAPTRVFYEITTRCPEKCSHCYTESGKQSEGELDLEEKRSIIDQMVDMGCFRISIAGGEPLVEPDFFPFVEYALEQHVDVSFSTSGTPVTEAIARRLADLDIRTINVSLDGWDEDSYRIPRGENRFKHMLRGVAYLRRFYSRKIAAKCTLMTSNILHLDRIIEVAEKLGFDVVKFNCVREAGRAMKSLNLIPTQDEYLESVRILAEIYNQKKYRIKIVLPVNPYQNIQLEGDVPDFVGELGFGCYAGKESFCITPIGNIQPCSSFGPSLYVDGNVKDRRLQDAWLHGSAMNAFRGFKGASACQTCPSYQGCRGGCYLRSLKAYGDVQAVDPYCYEYRNVSHESLPPVAHRKAVYFGVNQDQADNQ